MDDDYISIVLAISAIGACVAFILLLCYCFCRKRRLANVPPTGSYQPNVSVISEPHPSPSEYHHDIETGYQPHSYAPTTPAYQPTSQPQHGSASWSVAIKKPGNRQRNILSTKAWYTSSGANHVQETEDIMIWVNTILDSQQWDGFFVYNDQPPGCGRGPDAFGPDPSSKGSGHCKGIVVWNRSYLGWLVHSVPRWPEGSYVSLGGANRKFPKIEHSQLVLAQSFAWVVLPFHLRTQVLQQLEEIQAFVFYSSPNTIWPYQVGMEIGARADNGRSVPRMISLGSGIAHIAKNGSWNACIYHDYMGMTGLGKGRPITWRVQTWTKEADLRGLEFYHVADVRSLKFPDDTKYKNMSAHSKWAISHDPQDGLVFIGDLNRATSQNKRGGGGILIASRTLWEFLDSLCVSYFHNGVSYEE
jgi:hypothetical protein